MRGWNEGFLKNAVIFSPSFEYTYEGLEHKRYFISIIKQKGFEYIYEGLEQAQNSHCYLLFVCFEYTYEGLELNSIVVCSKMELTILF